MTSRIGSYEGLHYRIQIPEKAQYTLLYVHGGPGAHSAFFEKAVEEWPTYRNSRVGWVTYDQRGCGRSLDESWDMTHACNLKDLENLCHHLQKSERVKIDAVVGHSYGGKLVLDLMRTAKSTPLKFVVLGLGFDPFQPRNRSLVMDLFALKTQQREAYETIYGKLLASSDLPWRLAADVRRAMRDTELRKYFYWANLSAMDWYFGVKKTLPFDENDKIFRKVRDTVFDDDVRFKAETPAEVPKNTLWILGLHDFLMGGENAESLPHGVKSFKGSGHYPQYEEPERFLEELERFLGAA